MSVDPTLQAALGAPVVDLFCAIRFDLPARPLLMLDGAAQVSFDAGYGVETFSGLDPEFGAIGSVEEISGGDDEEAPELQLSFFPADGVAAATLASPDMQGAEVLIFIGVLDRMTGLTVGQPYLQFMGEIDVPVLGSQAGSETVDFTIVSVFERLFANQEGVRATDGWHQSIWPGERGLEFMTGTTETLYWGGKPAAYDTTNYAPGQTFTASVISRILNK